MANAGHPVHIEEMKNDPWHAHMVDAFEQAMLDTDNNVAISASVAFKEFRTIKLLATSYDFQVAYSVHKNRSLSYNPNVRADKILSADKIYALGDIGVHGNYMNEDIRSYINDLANNPSLNNTQAIIASFRKGIGLRSNASLACN